ncbi:MAG TPA: nucleotide exchange factor GrpE [bacterium]|nr:nucleotide exchange factor GrpE [bacterium]
MRIPVKVIRKEADGRREELGPGWDELRPADYFADSRPARELLMGGADADPDYPPERPEENEEPARDDGGAPDRGEAGGSARPGYVSRDDLSGRADPGDWKNKYVRLLADFENYKRHAEAERDRLSGIGKESVLDDLFPLVEHMERAIQAARDAGGGNGILEGLELVYRELLAVLEKHGVERIRARGQLFDPRLHEAAAAVPSPGTPEGTILEELRPGFTRQGRLLRPATVVVAR